MGGGGQQSTSKNPAWLDKAGEDLYGLTRNYVFGQPLGGSGGAFSTLSSSTGGGTKTGGTKSTAAPLSYYQKMGGMTDPVAEEDGAGGEGEEGDGLNFRQYEQYDGTRVAKPTGNQGQAIEMARNTGSLDGYFDHANQMIDVANKRYGQGYTPGAVDANNVGTGRFSEEAASPFMSAYTMSALDPVARKMDVNNTRAKLARNAKSAMQGAFGGTRTAVEDSLQDSEHEQNVRDLYATGMDRAFNTALQGYQTEQDRVLRGDLANQAKDVDLGKFNEDQRLEGYNANRDQYNAEQSRISSNAALLGQLAGTKNNISNDEMNRLLTTGAIGQQYHQNVMDTNYNDFTEQRDYPMKMLQLLQGVISGSPSQGAITVTNKPSMAGQLLGAGTALGSAFLSSDARIKEHARWVGAKNGFNLYEFRYRGKPGTYRGVMAQEVALTRPDAVKSIGGILHVNYDAIGVEMETVDGI